MKIPSTSNEWIEVARERGADAEAIFYSRRTSIGSVYMVGYAIECALKAYLQYKQIPRPIRGPEGHNLRGLWKSAGFRFADLKDCGGKKSFFLEQWSTDFRYQANLQLASMCSGDLVKAAQSIVRWINGHIKRCQRRTE